MGIAYDMLTKEAARGKYKSKNTLLNSIKRQNAEKETKINNMKKAQEEITRKINDRAAPKSNSKAASKSGFASKVKGKFNGMGGIGKAITGLAAVGTIGGAAYLAKKQSEK